MEKYYVYYVKDGEGRKRYGVYERLASGGNGVCIAEPNGGDRDACERMAKQYNLRTRR